MSIVTKTGDDGYTGVLGPGRWAKNHARIEAYGTVDELNAAIGVVRAVGREDRLDGFLARIQSHLFSVGAALADPDPRGRFHQAVTAEMISDIEHAIAEQEAILPTLTNFILPGGTPTAAHLHLARAICRRAERRVVSLSSVTGEHVPETIIVYLNRLGDLLFLLARSANLSAGVSDVIWEGFSEGPFGPET